MKSNGASLAWGITGAFLAIAGVVVYLLINGYYATCSSPAGQIGQGISSAAANDCGVVSLAHWGGVLSIPVGIVLFVYAIWRVR